LMSLKWVWIIFSHSIMEPSTLICFCGIQCWPNASAKTWAFQLTGTWPSWVDILDGRPTVLFPTQQSIWFWL
jgi:hypothetical protein